MNNITSLNIQENGFAWGSTEYQESYQDPGINITIENANITVLPGYAFTGQIRGLTIKNSKIGTMNSFAFSKLAGTESVLLSNCEIKTAQAQAFKKFIVDYFAILGGNIGNLPSYWVNDVTVRKDMRLEGVKFQTVNSQAFKVSQTTNFHLEKCTIEWVHSEAFRASTNGPVFIMKNVFNKLATSAFGGLSVDPHYQSQSGKQELVFENNTLVEFYDGALTFNTLGFKVTVDRIVLQRECSCADIGTWTSRLVVYTTPPSPSNVGKLIWCEKNKRDKVADEFYAKHCKSTNSMIFIIIGVVLVAIVIIVVVCIVTYFLCRRRILKKYINVPTESNCNRHSNCSGGSNHVMIVPDGKTYRETELHVIVERAEPITEFKLEPVVNEIANRKD